MSLNITFKSARTDKNPNIILTLFEGSPLGPQAKDLDKSLGGLIAHSLGNQPKFKAKAGQTLDLSAPAKSGLARITLLGLGKAEKLDALGAENAGGKLCAALERADIAEAALWLENLGNIKGLKIEDLAANLANGARLRAYKFERYKSKKGRKGDKDDAPTSLSKLMIICKNADRAKTAYETLSAVTDGVYLARDLVNTPPNDLYPESFAKIIKDELKPLGVEIDVLDEKKMQKMGMGAILAVGMGSARPPRMVIMRWPGAKTAKGKAAKPLAFVGKGVTFDTGGISIKPAAGMDEMKMDMGGAAAVVGLLKAAALRKSKTEIIGVVGLAENMPSSKAYRPADILKSYSGQTIEVLNTDAEGRLVLADCLTYVQETYKPQFVINLATLTGAIIVALGHEYCGAFVNQDSLWKQLNEASAATGEKLWRMPLDEAWRKDLESPVADIQNIGKSGRGAGACTAAGFLSYFIEDKMHWAHLDIAGTAWIKGDRPTVPRCATGFGVRLLNHLVSQYYES